VLLRGAESILTLKELLLLKFLEQVLLVLAIFIASYNRGKGFIKILRISRYYPDLTG
jgi:hypothetical protein